MTSSLNTYNSLKFLEESNLHAVFVTTNTNKFSSDLGELSRLSFHRKLLFFYRFIFHLIAIIVKYGSIGMVISDKILEATGLFEACKAILKKGKPEAMIFANDHNIKNRALMRAAEQLQIPTIYIQHASISEVFPPLDFDLNLLEGQDTLDKYQKIGPVRGKVHLVGMPKFDWYKAKRKKRAAVQNIGVCGNLLDEIEKIESLIDTLYQHNMNWNITYRPHPRDKRMLNSKKVTNINDSKEIGIFEYLLEQDLIICGNTSTHLEAVILNIPSIYYNMSYNESPDDYYGYVKNGLIQRADDIDNVIELINYYNEDLEDIFHKASYFNALIGTEYDGKSQELCLQRITNFLSDRN